MSEAERVSPHQMTNRPEKICAANHSVDLSKAVQWAEEHLLDRNLVVLETIAAMLNATTS